MEKNKHPSYLLLPFYLQYNSISEIKGRIIITVDLTMEHLRNISVDQPITYTEPC